MAEIPSPPSPSVMTDTKSITFPLSNVLTDLQRELHDRLEKLSKGNNNKNDERDPNITPSPKEIEDENEENQIIVETSGDKGLIRIPSYIIITTHHPRTSSPAEEKKIEIIPFPLEGKNSMISNGLADVFISGDKVPNPFSISLGIEGRLLDYSFFYDVKSFLDQPRFLDVLKKGCCREIIVARMDYTDFMEVPLQLLRSDEESNGGNGNGNGDDREKVQVGNMLLGYRITMSNEFVELDVSDCQVYVIL